MMQNENFSNKKLNVLSQLIENGRITSWVNLKDEYEWTNDMFFQWSQLKLAIPTKWKTFFSIYGDIEGENMCKDYDY